MADQLPDFIPDDQAESFFGSQVQSSLPDFIPDSEADRFFEEQEGWFNHKAKVAAHGAWEGVKAIPSAIGQAGSYLAGVGSRTLNEKGGPGLLGTNFLTTMAEDAYRQAEHQSAPQTISQGYNATFGNVPIVGPLLGASIQGLADASDEYRGLKAPTTGDEKLEKASGMMAATAAPKVIGKTLETVVTPTVENWAGASSRKSLGARKSDYLRTANDLDIVEPIPGGDLQTFTKKALNELIESGELGASRDPAKLLKTASTKADDLSAKVHTLVDAYDQGGGAPVMPQFNNALKYLSDGEVPADKVNAYLKRLADLQAEINNEGKGALAYTQQQKIALGRDWKSDDATLSAFNREIYKDLQQTIEAAIPGVKPLNQELAKYKTAIPIFQRTLTNAESMTPQQLFWDFARTTGGAGAPMIAGGMVGGLPGALLGLGAGAAVKAAGTPQGLRLAGGAMRKGAGLSELGEAVMPIFGSANAALLSGARSRTGDPSSSEYRSQYQPPATSLPERLSTSGPARATSSERSTNSNPYVPRISLNSPASGGENQGSSGRYRALAEALSPAIERVESGGNPAAESPKGAIGTHQVMPIAARDVLRSQGIDDRQFTDAELREILRQPGMSKQFGDAYMALMLERYGGNKRLAAGAYNGGPSRLDERGRDISKMPAETRDYVKKLARALA